MRPLQKQGKSVTTIPTKKPKGTSLAKVGNTTKVAKATVTTPPQKSAIVKRSSLSPKKLPPQRVVQQSQAKTLTQTTNYDRLFDE
jgi:hypothetical protein